MKTKEAISTLDVLKSEFLVNYDFDFYLALELAKRSLSKEIPVLRRKMGTNYFCPLCKARVRMIDYYCPVCGNKFISEDERYDERDDD